MLPERNQARSALGVTAKKARKDPSESNRQELAEARRTYAAVALAEYIERTLAAAPPLTTEQRDRLASLLRGAA